jgi:opacity protein-like surface antigen
VKKILVLWILVALAVSVAPAQELRRIMFEGGVGATIPSGSAYDRFNTGFNILVGGGWNFTPHIAGLLEFQYDRNSLTNSALAAFGQPAGFNRFWSLTANPRYRLPIRGPFGAYGTAGYGLYSRQLAFTDPSQAGTFCDPFYGYCESAGAPVVASFTNYKGGFNAGGGATYALGESGFRVFADFRYHQFLSHANNEFLTLSFGIQY